MSDRIPTLQIITEAQNDHRGHVSRIGPDAWEARCDCTWSSGCFYDEKTSDNAQFAHDEHLAKAILDALTANHIAIMELAALDEDDPPSVPPVGDDELIRMWQKAGEAQHAGYTDPHCPPPTRLRTFAKLITMQEHLLRMLALEQPTTNAR